MQLLRLLIINLKFIIILSHSYEEYLCDINVNYKICLDGGCYFYDHLDIHLIFRCDKIIKIILGS